MPEKMIRDTLEMLYGKNNVWDTDEAQMDFEIDCFLAPYVIVKRKSDGVTGTLMFQHEPRFYYSFVPQKF